MDKTKVYFNTKERPKNPIMIVGLPGIGTVGSLVGEHLRNTLRAKRLATLYSHHFLHQAIMMKNGGVRLVSNRFYWTRNEKTGQSIIILVGDMQAGTPEGQYEINDKIVKFFKSLGGKTIYTVGGYNISNQYVSKPRVFGVATDKETRTALSKSGVVMGQAAGAIWGSAGLIVAFSKEQKMHAACLMGETGMLEIDANAAKAVLEKLKDMLKLDIDLSSIDKIKAETESLLKEMEKAGGAPGEQQAPPPNQPLSYIR